MGSPPCGGVVQRPSRTDARPARPVAGRRLRLRTDVGRVPRDRLDRGEAACTKSPRLGHDRACRLPRVVPLERVVSFSRAPAGSRSKSHSAAVARRRRLARYDHGCSGVRARLPGRSSEAIPHPVVFHGADAPLCKVRSLVCPLWLRHASSLKERGDLRRRTRRAPTCGEGKRKGARRQSRALGDGSGASLLSPTERVSWLGGEQQLER
jgi:hypothetical protein